MDSFLRNMITARLNVRVFPGGYDYRSVEVNGTEFTDVAVPLIYMAAGLQMDLLRGRRVSMGMRLMSHSGSTQHDEADLFVNHLF